MVGKNRAFILHFTSGLDSNLLLLDLYYALKDITAFKKGFLIRYPHGIKLWFVKFGCGGKSSKPLNSKELDKVLMLKDIYKKIFNDIGIEISLYTSIIDICHETALSDYNTFNFQQQILLPTTSLVNIYSDIFYGYIKGDEFVSKLDLLKPGLEMLAKVNNNRIFMPLRFVSSDKIIETLIYLIKKLEYEDLRDKMVDLLDSVTHMEGFNNVNKKDVEKIDTFRKYYKELEHVELISVFNHDFNHDNSIFIPVIYTDTDMLNWLNEIRTVARPF